MKTPPENNEIINLIPENKQAAVKESLSLIRQTILSVVVVIISFFLLLFIIRFSTALFFRGSLSEDYVNLAQLAGLDERGTEWVTSIFGLVIGIILAGAVFTAGYKFITRPFSGMRYLWQPLGIILLITGSAALLPWSARKVMDLDNGNNPIRMKMVDPKTSTWFSAYGEAEIYYSQDEDGTLHFWNREGFSPTDRSEVKPVTPEIRQKWEKSRKSQKTPLSSTGSIGNYDSTPRVAPVPKSEPTPIRPFNRQQPSQPKTGKSILLQPNQVTRIPVYGSNYRITWNSSPIEVWADNHSPRRFPTGGTFRFSQYQDYIYIRLLNNKAAYLQLDKLPN